MNDERFLKDWLRDTTDDTTDPQASTDRVLARVPEIRQRSRWWPWLPAHRAQPRPTDDDHPPTVSGRTILMFSPIKAITAGALVFAVGGVLLIAQPFDQQGDAPGAAVDAVDPGPAAYVNGFMEEGESDSSAETYDEERMTLRGSVTSVTMEMDDPRLSGAGELTYSIDEFLQPDTSQRVEVHWGELTITNDHGGWSGSWKSTYDASRLPEELELVLYELTGTGAYEGLSALLARTGRSEGSPNDPRFEAWPLGGAIFPGPLPPASAHDE